MKAYKFQGLLGSGPVHMVVSKGEGGVVGMWGSGHSADQAGGGQRVGPLPSRCVYKGWRQNDLRHWSAESHWYFTNLIWCPCAGRPGQ